MMLQLSSLNDATVVLCYFKVKIRTRVKVQIKVKVQTRVKVIFAYFSYIRVLSSLRWRLATHQLVFKQPKWLHLY